MVDRGGGTAPDELSRRGVLKLLGASSLSGLAGCPGQQGQSSPTSESPAQTPTSAPADTPTDTTAATATASDQTATASPSIAVEVSFEEGTNAQILSVTGQVTSPKGVDRILVQTDENQVQVDVDSAQEYSIDSNLEVAGGRSYTIEVTVVDSNGRQATETVETTHIPIFIDPLETDRLVGAHYYPWYEIHGGHQNWTDRTVSDPVLGEYSADDPRVIDQHLKWCLEHGIQWLSMSWWGPDSGTDRALKNAILEAEQFREIEFSILYETVGRLESYAYDLDSETAQNRFTNDMLYLEETYFQRENYLHIDDRPVVFLYVSHALEGDIGAAFDAVAEQLETEPYVLADIPFGAPPGVFSITPVADAITTYNPYAAQSDIESIFHDLYETGTKTMHLGADASDVGFVPVVLPGFNDTGNYRTNDRPVLSASPERYERVCEQVAPHLEEGEAVLITSFNEWYENTQVEPAETYDTAYLELTAEHLATGASPEFNPSGVTVRLTFNKTIVPAEVNPDSTDTRELAFLATGLRLVEDGDEIRAYNIGLTTAEPLFLEGVFGPESNEREKTWRWFGGRDAETTLFIEGNVAGADQLVLIGEPMRSDEIEADVFFDGRRAGHVEFQERDGQADEYEIQL